MDNVLRDCYQPAITCIGQAVATQQNIVESATERTILLVIIKLYSAGDEGATFEKEEDVMMQVLGRSA